MNLLDSGGTASLRSLPASLDSRRRKQLANPESFELESLIRTAAQSPEAETRALGLALARLSAMQADDLQTIEALRAKSTQVHAIVKNLLTALITIDEKGTIWAVNPAAELMFGYSFEELEGRSVALLLPFESHEEAIAELNHLYFGSKSRSVELQGRRKNGETFPCELMMFPTETGHGWRFTGNIRDLTDKKAAERLRTDLVSIVSHELRTPLTSIRGSLRLVESGTFGDVPDDVAELIGIAERNCTRLIDLVGDMLDLETLTSGQLELNLKPTPLRTVIEKAVEGVKGFAAENRIRIEVDQDTGIVWADSERLVQVLINFLSNAVKFSPPGGLVKISTRERRGAFEVQVEDRGRGVPQRFLHSIFERFGQVETADSREKGGTGLGLAICKSIVNKHSGHIGVESEEGKGSRFFFSIPKIPNQEENVL